MAKDFFDGLSRTISRTAKELSGHAENLYEMQKVRSQISAEERLMEKGMTSIGEVIYKRYASGEVLDEELAVLCEEISRHDRAAEGLKDKAAGLRGQKLCTACGKSVERSVAFCPYCGAACPTPEPVKEVCEPVEETCCCAEEAEVKEACECDCEEKAGEECCCGSDGSGEECCCKSRETETVTVEVTRETSVEEEEIKESQE